MNKNKFFLIFGSIVLNAFSPVIAKEVRCDDANTRALIAIAKSNGYDWPGAVSSAKCDLEVGYAITWSGLATGGTISAVMQTDPVRIQFRRGGSMDLFCVKLISGRWENVGKNCN
jgi:hypothetical protein